jgi:intracellular sulfur oxidation DsrE/DsrF family protein
LQHLSAEETTKHGHHSYGDTKVVYEFYFNDPAKIGAALDWLRLLYTPLMAEPYNLAPERIHAVVVIHGAETVTLAKKNQERYREYVDRMEYYDALGVRFKVCGLSAKQFGYGRQDIQDFVDIVPSAVVELAHWQQLGYAFIVPRVLEKIHRTDSIR